MNILSFTFFLTVEHTHTNILKMDGNQKLTVAIDLVGKCGSQWVPSLVIIILQNNFCFQYKKETHTGLEQLERE